MEFLPREEITNFIFCKLLIIIIISVFSWPLKSLFEGRDSWLHPCQFCQCKTCMTPVCFCRDYSATCCALGIGLQAEEGVHHCSESDGVHVQGLLEDGSRQEVCGHYNAMSTPGGWAGERVKCLWEMFIPILHVTLHFIIRGWTYTQFMELGRKWVFTIVHIIMCVVKLLRRCATSTGQILTSRSLVKWK